ncbi:hypothetical protein WS86_15265 [Burkholderia savannae]|nr:hypothetical protein WS86_15265 [Burkholderia savannae]
MDDLYLQQLPADLQALVQDIEGLSGFIIQVEVDAARRGTLASYVDEHRATLLLPREDFFRFIAEFRGTRRGS